MYPSSHTHPIKRLVSKVIWLSPYLLGEDWGETNRYKWPYKWRLING